MTKPDIETLVKALGAQERVLLFCLGSGTDWKEAGVTLKTVAGLVSKSLWLIHLVRLVGPSKRLALTEAGRAALRALLRDL
jgi:hypothetical protein